MAPESKDVRRWNVEGKRAASPIIKAGGRIGKNARLKASLKKVNELGAKLNGWVYNETKKLYAAGKIPVIVGGDHAVPFGAFQATAEHCGEFGILHFDAHSDTRKAFEGFEWSHASIMHNALQRIPPLKKLVQVGIRDFCQEEYDYVKSQGERVAVFYDERIAARKHAGESWAHICDEIVAGLPRKVWISFDIDGLDPQFCPHTGTPVPGGMHFQEALSLIKAVAKSGRIIVGFDLNEVAPGAKGDEWDGNVGARLLYKMTGWCMRSQKLV